MYWQRGYQQNQFLFTKLLIIADDLSKYANLGFSCVLVPFHPLVSRGIITSVITGSSTISNQLEAGSIMVRHMKSITVPSLPLIVYRPIRSTHNTSQGFVMTNLVGSFPYLCLRLLLTWHAWQFLTYLQMVFLIPFQYIAEQRVSSSLVCPGCCR